MDKPRKFTSLWAVIESMQRNLEREGLDEQVVDAAVTSGLETLLRTHRPAADDRDRVHCAWLCDAVPGN